jgi:hypothetical protein
MVDDGNECKHLGSIFTEDGKNTDYIITRIKDNKVISNNKRQQLCSNDFSLEIKKKVIKSCICSVAVCGSETWTVGENVERVVNGFVVLLFVDQKHGM